MEECHPRKEDQGKLDSEVGEGRMRRNTLRRRQQVHQLGDQVVQKKGPYGTTQEKETEQLSLLGSCVFKKCLLRHCFSQSVCTNLRNHRFSSLRRTTDSGHQTTI